METYSFYNQNALIVFDYSGVSNPLLPPTAAYPYHQFNGVEIDGGEVLVHTNQYVYRISPANDTVILAGTNINPGTMNIAELSSALRSSEVFLNPCNGCTCRENDRGLVLSSADLSNISDPAPGNYVRVVQTGTIWNYNGTTWINTEQSYQFSGIYEPVYYNTY